jgi:hypothetical protein
VVKHLETKKSKLIPQQLQVDLAASSNLIGAHDVNREGTTKVRNSRNLVRLRGKI